LVEPLAAGPPSIAGVPAPDPMYPFTGETLLSIRGRDWNVPGNRLPLAETRTEAAVLPRNREPRWYVPERKSARTASGGRTPQAGAAAIRAFPQLPGLGIAPQAVMELRLRVPDSLPKSEPTLVRGLPRL